MRIRSVVATIVVGVALVTTMFVPAQSAAAAGDDCQFEVVKRGACSTGAIAGGTVDLKAQEVDEPVVATARPNHDAKASNLSLDPPAPPPIPRGRLAADVDTPCQPGIGACLDGQHAFLPPAKAPAKPADPAPAAPAVPGVTLDDVAGFVPRDASIRSQPNGWALVGAPVNLLTDASAQVVGGTLLGRPAQVRFVPVSFTWDHGDGTSTTVDDAGSTWRDLRQQDFTATPTSHVYTQMGARRVSLTIAYSPSYRFDGGAWQAIPGTLPVTLGPVTIHVLQGSTVLVGGVCGSRSAGPGC
jgi:hypothetical protein